MSISQANFCHICEIVEKHSAIMLSKDKQYLVESRLFPIVKLAGFASIDAMVSSLRSNPKSQVLHQIVDAMTTNETSFFRDRMPFQILAKTVLPELIEKRKFSKTIRTWSAACSSGQEPYSMAMLWREQFMDNRDWQFKILATDISKSMLDRAREGRYSGMELGRGLTDQQKEKHFIKSGNDWTIHPDLKSSVEYKQMNLIEPYPVAMMVDVVFLRNVLVYFDLEAKRSILGRVREVLAPDGYLFLGGAETTVMIDDAFERVACGSGSYYRIKA